MPRLRVRGRLPTARRRASEPLERAAAVLPKLRAIAFALQMHRSAAAALVDET